MSFRYAGYDASRTIPNIVVDGAANEATVLTLSHWPGAPTPAELARDLSAEIAFAYLDAPCVHPPAEVVTNNHFDVDGLVSIFALVEPDAAQAHRDLLVDVAAAGDFGTFRDRRAARAAMALAALSAEEADDCTYTDHTDRLYTELLPQLLEIVLDNEHYRDRWADEDAQLTASEAALTSGLATIIERPELDLAIVRIDPDEPTRWGHVVGECEYSALHPMALHNATGRFRILVIHGRRYRYVDRYETWVQYVSRPTLPRVDMAPLAAELTSLERGGATWTAGSPTNLTPSLTPDDESTIDADIVVASVERFLRAAASDQQ